MMHELWQSFLEGGWGMGPIFLFGLLAVTAAGRFAWRGEHQLTSYVRWMAATTVVSGFFGFGTAMLKVLSYVVYEAKPEERLVMLLLGTKEALNTLTFSLMFLSLICLLVAIGFRRFPLPNPSAMPR
jgi:hypothetical protein